MAHTDQLIAFGATYDNVADAMYDFAEMKKHYKEGLGEYDAAIVTKEESGMLIVSNADTSGGFGAAVKGAVAGAVLGVIFPPSVIGLAALGAAGGAAAGHVRRHLSRGDMKELGELLEAGESGIILVTESVTDEVGAKLFERAKRSKAIKVEGDAEAIKAAVRQAAGH